MVTQVSTAGKPAQTQRLPTLGSSSEAGVLPIPVPQNVTWSSARFLPYPGPCGLCEALAYCYFSSEAKEMLEVGGSVAPNLLKIGTGTLHFSQRFKKLTLKRFLGFQNYHLTLHASNAEGLAYDHSKR